MFRHFWFHSSFLGKRALASQFFGESDRGGEKTIPALLFLDT
jgi:hypothetical protein